MAAAAAARLARPLFAALPPRRRRPGGAPARALFGLGGGSGGSDDERRARPVRSSDVQGGLMRQRCDMCTGTGKIKCAGCNKPEGFGPERKGKREGYRDVLQFGFFGDVVDEVPCEKCDATGSRTCPRCGGNKVLVYRNADWK